MAKDIANLPYTAVKLLYTGSDAHPGQARDLSFELWTRRGGL